MNMLKAKLKVEDLESREQPSSVVPEPPTGTITMIAPQDPVIIEPEIKIILPGDKK
ncbi:MAG: hypothetical protein K1X57_08370 [Gemmataceae bacterium]|nr:hypothetical protein [Gemmataceae bacterium]